MPPSAPPSTTPRRHVTLKLALCVCNAATACELGFVAVFLALFTLFDNHRGFHAAYVPFVVIAVILAATGAVLAKLVWREQIGTTVFNLFFSLFNAAAAVIIMTSNGFRLIFSAMGVAPLAGCCLSVGYLVRLRRDKRERQQAYIEGSGSASMYEHNEDEPATEYECDVAMSPSAAPQSPHLAPHAYRNTA